MFVFRRLFPSKEKLKEHSNTHKKEEIADLTCQICNKKFQTKRRREIHCKSHVKNHNVEGSENKCSLCSRIYKDATTLKRHFKKIHNLDLEVILIHFILFYMPRLLIYF